MAGDERWFTAMSSMHYGECLIDLARYEGAESVLLTTYTGFKDLNGEQDENTQSALAALADLYDTWGKPEKAAEWRTKLPTEQEAVASDHAGQSQSSDKQDE